MKISVVIPVYACSKSLVELSNQVKNVFDEIKSDFEILFVNDGYTLDNAWQVISDLAKSNEKIKGINLSRNFGQHYAIFAGLEHATGDWIVVMDCDLQDNPQDIKYLLNKALEGYDIVLTKRQNKQHSLFKKITSKLFYKTLSYLTDTKQDSSIANYGIYKKNVIKAVLELKDKIKYFPTMIQWVGFKKTTIEVAHQKRFEGNSSYSFSKLIHLAFNNIITFSNKPLYLIIKFGFSVVILTTIVALYFLVLYLNHQIKVIGYTSLILSVWFLSGIIMMMLGFLGIYIGKIFDQVKDRPTYIISDKINL